MSKVRKSVTDLGIAAYARMHGFKVVGRKGKTIFFEVEAADQIEFDKTCFEYLNSPFMDFDNHLMAIKKTGEFMPSEG